MNNFNKRTPSYNIQQHTLYHNGGNPLVSKPDLLNVALAHGYWSHPTGSLSAEDKALFMNLTNPSQKEIELVLKVSSTMEHFLTVFFSCASTSLVKSEPMFLSSTFMVHSKWHAGKVTRHYWQSEYQLVACGPFWTRRWGWVNIFSL